MKPPKLKEKFNFFSNLAAKNKIMLRELAKKILAGSIIFLIVLLVYSLLYLAYQKFSADKFFSGAKLARIDLSGRTLPSARREILRQIDAFSREGLTVVYQNKTISIPAAVIGPNPDLSFDLFSFNQEESLQALFKRGRGRNVLNNIASQLKTFVSSPDGPLNYYLDDQKLLAMLSANFSSFENKARDAEIILKNGSLTVSPEKYGKIFNYELIIASVKNRLAFLDNAPIKLSLQTAYPAIYASELDESVLAQAESIIKLAPVKLTAVSKNPEAKDAGWSISKEKLSALITAKKSGSNELYVGLKPKEFAEYLQAEVAPVVTIEPVDAKFQITGDKVTEFKSSRNGQKLNIDNTLARLEQALIKADAAGQITVELAIDESVTAVTNENINTLGIKEIVGTGFSNFAGSPANRRHNIAVGAAAVNGTLIKPGEEFSLLKTLGEVDARAGYLPELVIKENKTIPEYGGGLCQIGTTVFRSTLASGLPIIERRNHSYRVQYYEPAGTDATIYSPAPDFKFKNDTKNYILIQSRLEGNNLYFDFWGTRDGRVIEQAKPKIYNVVSPPPGKIIETETLKPGEKKCTERAHNGADASLAYKVTYPDGSLNEQIFLSHYRPWQEVCLIGVTASSTPETTLTPNATDNNISPADLQ